MNSKREAFLLFAAFSAAIFGSVACSKKAEPEFPHAAKANEASEVVGVSTEDLINTPSKFAGRRVRVTGYWVQAFEYSGLHSEPKMEGPSPIWVERWSLPGGKMVKDPQAITAAIEQAYKAVGSDRTKKRDVLLMTVEGYFDHKASISTTKDSYPFQSGFGHLGQYQSQLTIERVIEIKSVSEDAVSI